MEGGGRCTAGGGRPAVETNAREEGGQALTPGPTLVAEGAEEVCDATAMTQPQSRSVENCFVDEEACEASARTPLATDAASYTSSSHTLQGSSTPPVGAAAACSSAGSALGVNAGLKAQVTTRLAKKTKSCPVCGGSCNPRCLASVDLARDFTAADSFGRALKRHREAATPGEGEPDSKATRLTAAGSRGSKRVSYDGRCKSTGASHKAPANFGVLPTWLRANPVVGTTPVHPTHEHLGYHRGVVWCWRCGCFAAAVPNHLRVKCDLHPSIAGARQLKRLRKGQTPRNSVDWPLAALSADLLAG